ARVRRRAHVVAPFEESPVVFFALAGTSPRLVSRPLRPGPLPARVRGRPHDDDAGQQRPLPLRGGGRAPGDAGLARPPADRRATPDTCTTNEMLQWSPSLGSPLLLAGLESALHVEGHRLFSILIALLAALVPPLLWTFLRAEELGGADA